MYLTQLRMCLDKYEYLLRILYMYIIDYEIWRVLIIKNQYIFKHVQKQIKNLFCLKMAKIGMM